MRVRKYLLLPLLAALVCMPLSVCGCPSGSVGGARRVNWDTVDRTSNAYRLGQEAGEKSGYLQAQADLRSGQEFNSTPALPQGPLTNDFRAGFTQGYISGYQKGRRADPDAAIAQDNPRYKEDPEYMEGYADGFNRGAATGYGDCLAGRSYNAGDIPLISHHGRYYNAGYREAFTLGYKNGYELARAGGREPGNWYEWYKSGGSEDNQAADYLDELDGTYKSAALFDPHYIYTLSIDSNHTRFKLSMKPEGGYIIVFEEEGKCELDAAGSTLRCIPEELHEKRPDELPDVLVFEVEFRSSNGAARIRLVDSRGEVWE